MKRSILLAAAMFCGIAATPVSRGATLRWVNGEAMEGDFVEATGSTATWKSEYFESPLVIGWDALRRIDWKAQEANPADPFQFSLRDGSSIYGDIVSITDSSVFIHGDRVGDAELKRSELLTARRRQGGSIIWAGPAGCAGWKPDSDEGIAGGHECETGPGGALVMPYFNRKFTLDAALPDVMDVDFRAHSTQRPNFRLFFAEKTGSDMRIETWDDQIVAVSGSGFQLIRAMQDGEQSIALHFTWDWKTRHLAVYAPGGDLLTQWDAPESHDTGPGCVFIRNKGKDLSLDLLRIRAGNGAAPAKYDAMHPRVEMDDGSVIDGAVVSGSAGMLQLAGTTVAMKDVDGLVFSNVEPAARTLEPRPPAAKLTFDDGTLLEGSAVAVTDGTATLLTSFGAQPLTARLEGILQWRAAPAGTEAQPPLPSLDRLDRLVIGDSTFHGSVSTSGSGDGPFWMPAGAAVPAVPAKSKPYEIVRYFPEDAPPPAPTTLFYTRGGDVLPGTLRGLDRTGVDFDSAITEHGRLSAAEIRAIQFDARGQMNISGFKDPAWRVVKGNADSVVRGDDGSLKLSGGCAIGHPGGMQASDISFSMGTQMFTALRLRLFCAGTDPSKSTNMLIATTGGQVVCGLEGDSGQFQEPRIQFGVNAETIDVRLAIKPDAVTLYLNGANTQTFSMPAASRHGTGLVMECASVWGNMMREVSVSRFSTVSQPGATWLPDVAPDAKEQALSVPRIRRDDPPRHALIAANGDLLRGEVEGVTTENFAFRAGMQELTVPRDRVKAIIWFGKPADAAPSPTPAKGSDVADELQNRINFRIMMPNAQFPSAIGMLRNQAQQLKFKFPKVPTDVGIITKPVRIGQETVGQALDRICADYGYRYHIDADGTVVFEHPDAGAGRDAAALVEKCYWLKPDALPAGAAAAATLAGKGINFPPGATAEWNADAGQLTVRNTEENQQRIAQALAAEFGAAPESPTHWVVLRSGARLALVVDHFDKDVITGHHPLYGRCTIPVADVVRIRSYPLDPSPVMTSLEGWTLAYAPEPALPEAGGDDSAMTGKAAPQFKLKLLAGGDFDLSQQKGKVVVLDFWATWCGPCVNSLPGLMQAMSGFTPDRVAFVAVNQDEEAQHVKQFIEARGWNLSVVLDDGARVGRQYGASAIPHTVIIGPDGKIAWVKTGSSPGGEDEAAKEVNQLLSPPR